MEQILNVCNTYGLSCLQRRIILLSITESMFIDKEHVTFISHKMTQHLTGYQVTVLISSISRSKVFILQVTVWCRTVIHCCSLIFCITNRFSDFKLVGFCQWPYILCHGGPIPKQNAFYKKMKLKVKWSSLSVKKRLFNILNP